MRQHRTLHTPAGWVAVVLVWSIASVGEAIVPDGNGRSSKAAVAKGRILLKLKDTVLEPADLVYSARRSFQAATADRSHSLDLLHAKYHVRAIQPLFAQWTPSAATISETSAIRRQRFTDHLRSVQGRHGRRTARAAAEVSIPALTDVYIVELPDELDIEVVCRDYAADTHVEYCQPDYLMEAQFVPNDPSYSQLWGLQRIQMPSAWDVTRGRGIVVGAVDTGVDYTHPDLALNIWRNAAEIAGNGIDDDRNGYVDDVRGWDFAYDDNNPSDLRGHGTHVAGTIAAVGNNGLGVIGVAPEATILPAKGLDDSGSGYVSDLAQAIVYAAMNGADVINNSWGCGYCPSLPLAEDAVRTAYGLGTVVVFAAGNEADDVANHSPTKMEEVIAVAATTSTDVPASFSNYGALLDVSAPGVSILSTWIQGSYRSISGTSMAAPHVAGLAALVLANDPSLGPQAVHQLLRSSADDIGALGFDVSTGYGRINAAHTLSSTLPSLTAQITTPASGAVLRQSVGQVTISGTAVGQAFQRYELMYGGGSAPAQWTVIGPIGTVPVTGGALGTWQIGSLADGPYTLRLLVTGTDGSSIENRVTVSLQAASTSPVTISSVQLTTTNLVINGSGVWYRMTIQNDSSQTFSNLTSQRWVEQGATLRAGNGTTIGTLPPGSFVEQSIISASDQSPTTGTGTFVPGPATAVFELLQGTQLLARHIVPVTLTTSASQPPVLDPIGSKTVAVSGKLTFTISATDPDGGPLIYSASGLPAGASFDPASRTFAWQPTAQQVGTHSVTFTVADTGGLTDSEISPITVTPTVSGQNLLTNSGFEQGKTDWNNWGVNKIITTATAFSGTASARINLASRDERWVHHDVVLLPGSARYYEVQAAVKTEMTTGQAYVRVQWKDPRGRVLRTDLFGFGSGTARWNKRSSGILTPPAGTERATVSLGTSAGSGTAYFDDVSLHAMP